MPSVNMPDETARPTILLAEDDAPLRNLSCQALRCAGYSVLPAADGRDAFGIFLGHAQEIDLVVTDFQMPHLNGLQLASEVERLRPELTVLIVSGNCDDAALQSSPLRKLSKPFHIPDLVRSVAAALERRDSAA